MEDEAKEVVDLPEQQEESPADVEEIPEQQEESPADVEEIPEQQEESSSDDGQDSTDAPSESYWGEEESPFQSTIQGSTTQFGQMGGQVVYLQPPSSAPKIIAYCVLYLHHLVLLGLYWVSYPFPLWATQTVIYTSLNSMVQRSCIR